MQTDEEGIFPDIAPADYHSERLWLTPSLSASVGKCLVEGRRFSATPRHVFSAHPRLNPNWKEKHKRQFDMGTAAHQMTLGRGAPLQEILYESYQSKKAQAQKAEAYEQGYTPVLSKEYDALLEMKRVRDKELLDCPWGHPFRDGQAEVALRWREETKFGPVYCKALIDYLKDDRPVEQGIDYKATGGSANPEGWDRRQLRDLGFDISAAFHRRGYKALGLASPSMDYYFVLQEWTAPYCCSLIAIPDEELTKADRDIQNMIDMWAWCIHKNQWPGYSMSPYVSERPSWMDGRAVRLYDEHIASEDIAREL